MARSVAIDTNTLETHTSEFLTEILTRRMAERANIQFVEPGGPPADLLLRLGIETGIGEEGYRISGPANQVTITGNDPRGLLYGVGKFLRTSDLGEKDRPEFLPGTWRGTSIPQRKVRGIYFATHFRNFYHCAPLPEIERYIEDIVLRGDNALTVWFDLHHYRSISETEAQKMIERLHAILHAAQRLGMSPGLLVLGNEAYHDSPVDWRADWTGGHDGYTRDIFSYKVELCPSIPEAAELMLKWRREVFEAFADLDLEYVWIWPHDQGGCTCSRCAPWGGNGFIKIAKPVAAMARAFWPKAKIILSTWYFDLGHTQEWSTFQAEMERDSSWIDYIMADFPGKFPEFPLKNGVPGGLPMISFPEISMYQSHPWGGYGTNPLPLYLHNLWNEAGHALAGGFPYSEGFFEDINKAIVSGLYWTGTSDSVDDSLHEYARFAYSARNAETIVEAIYLLETTNPRVRHENGKPRGGPSTTDPDIDEEYILLHPENVERAWQLLQQVDGDLHPAARTSWRWRILYLRGLIDSQLVANHWRLNDEIESAFSELIELYHAQTAIWSVRPPHRQNRPMGWV